MSKHLSKAQTSFFLVRGSNVTCAQVAGDKSIYKYRKKYVEYSQYENLTLLPCKASVL